VDLTKKKDEKKGKDRLIKYLNLRAECKSATIQQVDAGIIMASCKGALRVIGESQLKPGALVRSRRGAAG
jgi:hypothetical protein